MGIVLGACGIPISELSWEVKGNRLFDECVMQCSETVLCQKQKKTLQQLFIKRMPNNVKSSIHERLKSETGYMLLN